jgi:tripartite-type tricarboxylate transporter receptor subunit TctC
MKTNRLLFVAIGVLAGMGLPLEARAQNYPSRPITFVVPFAAGGLSDVPGRMLAAEMQGRIGQSIVVENRPGASGVTGAQSVLRAEPDGYTLLVNALADVQNLHYLSVPYDPIKDFALIGMVADGPPVVLIVNANLPYKSVADIVADVRANFARDCGDAAQCAGQDQHRAGAVSWLRPRCRRGSDRRGAGRFRFLLQRAAAA